MCVKTHKSAPNYVPLHHMDMHKVAGFILGETLNRASKQVRQIYIYILSTSSLAVFVVFGSMRDAQQAFRDTLDHTL